MSPHHGDLLYEFQALIDMAKVALGVNGLATILSEFTGLPVFVASGGFTVNKSLDSQERQLAASAVASCRATSGEL